MSIEKNYIVPCVLYSFPRKMEGGRFAEGLPSVELPHQGKGLFYFEVETTGSARLSPWHNKAGRGGSGLESLVSILGFFSARMESPHHPASD